MNSQLIIFSGLPGTGKTTLAKRLAARLHAVYLRADALHEHRARVEGRQSDIEGHQPPTWQEVLTRDYHPWTEPHLQIDTAILTIDEALDSLVRQAFAQQHT